MKDIITIFLNWNKAELTIQAIRSILASEKENTNIIIIDNGSSKGEKSILINYAENNHFIIIEEDYLNNVFQKNIEYIAKYNNILLLLKHNIGYAAGNNRGLWLASLLGYKYVLISNNDVFIEQPVLKDLKKVLENYDDIAVIGPKIVSKSIISQGPFQKPGYINSILVPLFYPIYLILNELLKNLRYQNLRNHNEGKNIAIVYRIMGCFMLMKLDAIEKIGYFDENTFLYGEEEILSERLLRIGYRVAYNPNIQVQHIHAETTRFLSKYRSFIMQIKSEIYYFKKYRNFNFFSIIIFIIAQITMNYIWTPLLKIIRNMSRK